MRDLATQEATTSKWSKCKGNRGTHLREASNEVWQSRGDLATQEVTASKWSKRKGSRGTHLREASNEAERILA